MKLEENSRLVQKIIDKHNAQASIEKNKRGTVYTLRNSEATLEVTIGEQWLGYDLNINRSVFGKSFGTAEDTDNYPLDGEHTSYAQEIFDRIISCLEAFLEHKIYITKDKKKPALALPVSEGLVKVVRRTWLGWNSKEVPAESSLLKGYRPLGKV